MKIALSFCILASTLLSYCTYAQTTAISGRVTDDKGKPVSTANIILLASDSTTFIKADITDEKGNFHLDIPNGKYFIVISAITYKSFASRVITINGINYSLPEVHLSFPSGSLKEVSVVGQKSFIDVHSDKIVVNVENSIINAGTTVMDVLSHSPGVTIDQNDNVSLKGKPGVNIMINGKVQPLAGADLANILKGMPSGSVDKIEIISNPSARYDAAGTAGIINIILKKDQRMGMNESLNAAYGQGVYPKTHAGCSVNYHNHKFNAYLNYNYSFKEGFNHLTLIRHFYNNGVYAGAFQQNHIGQYPSFRNHLINAGIDYNLSANTSIGIGFNGGLNSYDSRGVIRSNSLDAQQVTDIDSFFITNNRTSNAFNNYAVNINIKHSFDGTGKQLTADADYARYWNKNNEDLITYYYMPDGSIGHPADALRGDISGLTQLISYKVDFSDPLKNKMHLDAGIKTSFVTADNAPLFYNIASGTAIYDSSKSNHYVYNENINAAYISFSKEFTKWNFQAGLRAEQTNIKGDQKTTRQVNDTGYIQLFPNLSVLRHINKSNDLSISFSRRIERPGYDQLNPFKIYSDPTTIKAGYPYLLPATTNAVELSHVYNGRFITTISYSITNNVITEVLLPAPGRVTIQTQRNLATMKYYGISGAYTFQPAKWWSNVSNINVYYSLYEGDLANSNLRNGKPTFDLNTTNNISLPAGISAEISLFYQAPQIYGYMNLNELWMLNVGIQKNIFNKRGLIRLSATDIFWHGYPSATSSYSNYNESFVAVRDTRQFTLSFAYRFGKNTIAPVHRLNGGAEEEKKRIGNGNA
ncbi:MAG: TonB-dependent receptor [Taibaiella sp.]|nr:TonB-dependent receptor [Taibaiella sp.]